MPFEYTPYRSPYAGAIADLIGRQGDIAAERALADAKARTATVGAITNSLANIAQYRADAPKRELQQMQLAEARQKMADAAEARTAGNTFASMITDPNKGQFQPEGPDLTTPTGVVPAQDSFTTSVDGVELFDKAKVAQRMAQMGHGAWMMEHGDKVDELNKSLLEMDAFEKKSLQNAAMTWAALPDELQLTGASQILKVMGKRLSPEQVSVLQQQIDKGDVAGLKAAIAPLLPKPEYETVKQDDSVYRKNPDGTLTLVLRGTPKLTYTERENEAFGIPADKRTPEQQAMVDSWNARHPETVNTQWVLRRGVGLIEIKKGTSQPGDVPASEVPVPNTNDQYSPQQIGDQYGRFNKRTGNFETQDENGVWRVQSNAPLATTGTVRTRQATAATVASHFDRAKELLKLANDQGLLGPIKGRYAEFEAGKVGGTGDPEKDQLLGELRLYLSLARSGVAQLHGRGGANVAIVQGIEKKMDEGKMSYDALMGALNGMQDWVEAYASKPSTPQTNTSPVLPTLGPKPPNKFRKKP